MPGRWTSDPYEAIRADLEALGAVRHRVAASEGEREMLHEVRNRLPPATVGRIEGFVAFASPSLVVLIHAALLLGGALLGLWNPWIGTLLCGAVTLHLITEGASGRSLFRWVAPKVPSYNLVVSLPCDQPLGSLVVSAPLDAPRWRPDRPRWFRRPLQAVVFAAVAVTFVLSLRALAEPWGRPSMTMYLVSVGILVTSIGLAWTMQRRVNTRREDASAATALIEFLRRMQRNPAPGLQVVAVFTGCAHAYQNGMHAFLAVRGRALPQPLLVVALDEPGRAPVGAVVSEGPLWAQHHRPTGPALVERLRWAGADVPVVDHESVTDARAAMLWGYRALALVGGGSGESSPEGTAAAVDLLEALSRLYAQDLAQVPEAARLLQLGERHRELEGA